MMISTVVDAFMAHLCGSVDAKSLQAKENELKMRVVVRKAQQNTLFASEAHDHCTIVVPGDNFCEAQQQHAGVCFRSSTNVGVAP